VTAAILDNGRLLAVCPPATDRWEAPGGYLERDEALDEAVRRTVWEETGLMVRPVILTGVYKDMARGEVAVVFRCSLVGNEVDRHVDAARGRWLTADEVRSVMDDASAERLLDALRLGPPRIRSQDGSKAVER
jgi:ADP-ribose pyrophosphatase YjhB (NUDIX family)